MKNIAALYTMLMWTLASCSHQTLKTGRDGDISGPTANVEMLKAAVEETDKIYTDPVFWELVSMRDWIESPTPKQVIAGSEVARLLRQVRPAEQKYRFKHIAWGRVPFVRGSINATTASCTSTGPTCGTVNVNVKDHDALDSLVDTVAHENTHVIGSDSDDTTCHCTNDRSPRFTDTPPPSPESEVWLVSYSLGDLAQCYFKHRPDREKTWACFYSTVDGGSRDRKMLEHASHVKGISDEILGQLQAKAYPCPPASPTPVSTQQ